MNAQEARLRTAKSLIENSQAALAMIKRQIRGAVGGGQYFVKAHEPREKGVLESLEAEGYKIEKLTPTEGSERDVRLIKISW